MNDLLQRFLTALFAAAIAAAAIVLIPNGYGNMLFCAVVATLGLAELLTFVQTPRRYRDLALGGGVLLWLAYSFLHAWNYDALIWPALGLLPVCLSIAALFDPKIERPLRVLGGLVMGLVYCFLPFFMFFDMSVLFFEGAYDFRIPIGFLLLTWSLDVGAYFAGRFLGRRPLFKRISPKKTWAGSIGGIVLCLAMAGLFYLIPFAHEGIAFSWWGVAVIISVFSQLGDLVESMFKRSVNVKDSGSLLPGHGGMLDRFDGTYLSIPLTYCYFLVLAA